MTNETQIFEEDIELMVEKARQILGPIGQYDLAANLPNTRVEHPKYGVVWYGDTTYGEVDKFRDITGILWETRSLLSDG